MLGYSEVMAIALLMVLPAIGGWLIDSWWNLSPWCLILGAVLGLGMGFSRLLKLPGVADSNASKRSNRSGSRPAGSPVPPRVELSEPERPELKRRLGNGGRDPEVEDYGIESDS